MRIYRSSVASPLSVLDIGTNPADDPDLVVRKRTAVATTIALIVGHLVFTVTATVVDRPLVLSASLVMVAGQLVNLALFRRLRRIGLEVLLSVIIGYAAVFSGAMLFGGLNGSAGTLTWALLGPLGVILLVGGRAWIPAFLGLAALLSAALVLDPFIDPLLALPRGVAAGLGVVNVLGPAALGTGLVLYIDGQRREAKRQSDALLRNVLPDAIAVRLKAGERVIADKHDHASVLFVDIVNFTPLAGTRTPDDVVGILNDLFTAFDRLADHFALEKIKTIGDAYMVVAGVPEPRGDHAEAAMQMALAMHAIMAEQPKLDGSTLEIRTGIASGPLVAGVIGEQKFSYDLWGDTVNTAARMESSGIPGCIQVTDETCRLLGGRYPFVRRKGVEVKGKGLMETWTLDPTTLAGR
jgi:class 3 adenylate cyclase